MCRAPGRTRATSTPDDVIGYPRTWSTCVETIAPEILGPAAAPDARRAAALCFAQQAVAAETPAWPPWVRHQFVAELAALADDDGAAATAPTAPATRGTR